jgi:hypothetical protein
MFENKKDHYKKKKLGRRKSDKAFIVRLFCFLRCLSIISYFRILILLVAAALAYLSSGIVSFECDVNFKSGEIRHDG